ncbi:LysR family transcriptional regulator [Amycolatopsis sp. AA4]|uniref:LysR family transcriptional regulator n=1 Tax=Actinomycetes TaxID=1760 RepID=UPI0001B58AF8|nr:MULTISPECIES: LysR family transcriptional regulator [Actinomycetes]ATY11427.1 LysR family transcriptional regulator [Amycolatopsis sp. AA4]EFL07051.1 LysR-family transcriptional regulator [Streptomyces sp. AA4]
MADLDLRQLTTLLAVAEEGTFSRAATRLGYTQSSVSQHIAALERSVGGAVFDRPGGPRPVRITPLGAVVLEHGREVLAKANALTQAVDRFKAGEGRIDVGTLQSVSHAILPTVLRRLREEHPRCEIRLSEPDEPRLGELDLLFYDGLISDDTEHVRLMEDPYLAVARPGTLPSGPVPARELDGKPMVAWPSTCDQPRLEQSLAAAGAHPRIVFRSAGSETILSMVRAGMGLAVLPWLAIHQVVCRDCGAIHGPEGWPDLQVHDLDPTPARSIYLHWPRGRGEESPLAARTIEVAVEVARELAGQAPAARGSVPSAE